MVEQKTSTEDPFRESLKDAAVVVERLAPLCSSFEEMVQIIRLAVGTDDLPANDAQLRLIIKAVSGAKK